MKVNQRRRTKTENGEFLNRRISWAQLASKLKTNPSQTFISMFLELKAFTSLFLHIFTYLGGNIAVLDDPVAFNRSV